MLDTGDDPRLLTTRTLDTRWQPLAWPDLQEWGRYADGMRRQILGAAGLWADPAEEPRDPPRAEFYECIAHPDLGYSVEKVFFETLPGYLATGNLYRPAGRGAEGLQPRRAAILNPHGHQLGGRFNDDDLVSTPRRCITLARMGYVALTHDMAGLGDNTAIPHRWGDAHAWLRGATPLALQLWNAIRAVDLLQSLPDVDPERIGCTGESGGGTQTFLLTALDPRIRAAAPVTMVSALMQGGCACENAPGLRLDASNVEIAALAAPRPLCLVSATRDWTRETPRIEYPALRAIYALYGAEDLVRHLQVDAPHHYNREAREFVYRFFAEHLAARPGSRPSAAHPSEDDLPGIDAIDDLRAFSRRARPEGPEGDAAVRAVVEWFGARGPGEAPRTYLGAVCGVQVVPHANVQAERDRGEGVRLARRGHAEGCLLVEGAADGAPLALHALGRAYGLWPFGSCPQAAPWGRAGRGVLEPFFLTYNRSDAAWQAQDLLTALAWLDAPAAVTARPETAVAALLAAALHPEAFAGLDVTLGEEWGAGDEAGFLHAGNYLPGALRAGGVHGLAALAGLGRVTLRRR